MNKTEREIRKKIDELLGKAEAAGDAAAVRSIKLLSEARDQVIKAVAATDWQIYYLPQKKAAVERALNEFGRKFGVEITGAQTDAWNIGQDIVDIPLRGAGVMAVIPEIDTQALAALQDFSLDKVRGLTADGIKAINNEISLGLIGNKSPYDVMQAIAKDEHFKEKSIFKSLSKRAETIVKNEAGRALEKAGQLRKESAAKVVAGLQKQWFYGHSPKMPRLDHLVAAQKYSPGGKPGPIPVDEPFIVGGEKLMYPRDPAGSAANTINCG